MKKKKSQTKSSPSVYLIGDHALVEEFAASCQAAGFRVAGKLNPRDRGLTLPTYVSKRASPPADALLAVELTNSDPQVKKKNLQWLDKQLKPSKGLLTSSVTVTASEQATWIKRRDRLVGMSALPTLISGKLVELAASAYTAKKSVLDASEFFFKLGKQVCVTQDRIGMVMPRILCMLINEACFALAENIASPDSIDTAMKLGTNYPLGPIEWANRIGIQAVHDVLSALQSDLSEERYRIAPLLKQLAMMPRKGT